MNRAVILINERPSFLAANPPRAEMIFFFLFSLPGGELNYRFHPKAGLEIVTNTECEWRVKSLLNSSDQSWLTVFSLSL